MGFTIQDTLSNSLTTQSSSTYANLHQYVQIQKNGTDYNLVFNVQLYNNQGNENPFYSKQLTTVVTDLTTMYADMYAIAKSEFTLTTDVL